MIYYWRVKPNSNCLDQEYSDIFSFRTQGKVVGDALLLKNNYLIVDKGQQAIITKEELNVAGTQPEFIIFTVIEAPLEGTLKKSGEDLGAGAFFTMKDIESGQIGYL
ncbi:MAG: hypothetical protein LC127_07920, partial [Chitinophagales bacterium]|nr:hypothetical protein [Chitinophagales bacterium]